jgi:DNA sulfur modification protein DndD
MKLVSLKLTNWRSFHGENSIEFSTDPDKPITLIFGRSGAGKTALLNAFTWAIYGDFTEGFNGQQDLINREALRLDPDNIASVELQILHEDLAYRVRRTVDANQQVKGKSDVFVSQGGKAQTEGAIHQFLPRALKDIFFFPGETFGNASGLTKQGGTQSSPSLHIDKAIRSLLGGDIYENSVTDLQLAANSNALKAPRGTTNNAVDRAAAKYEEAQAKLNEAQNLKAELPKLLESAEIDAAASAEVARQFDPTSLEKYYKERNRLAAAVDGVTREIESCKRLYEKLANIAHGTFTRNAVNAALAQLDAAEAMDLMPVRIADEVLIKTLDAEVCELCGETLTHAARDRVQHLHGISPDSLAAVKSLEIRGQLKNYLIRSEETTAGLRREVELFTENFADVPAPLPDAGLDLLRATILECTNLTAQLEKKYSAELKDYEDSKPSDPDPGNSLERALVQEQKVRELTHRITRNDEDLERYELERQTLLHAYETAAEGARGARQQVAAINLIEEVKVFFNLASSGLAKYGRIDFIKAINGIYDRLKTKENYTVKVDDDFNVKVWDAKEDKEENESQGEKVLLLFSFLGAMAHLTPQYQKLVKADRQFEQVGSVPLEMGEAFPVVFDAPLAPLDDKYETELITNLPSLFPQIIILVNDRSVAKWEKIEKRIGRVAVMELTAKGQETGLIRWNGKDHPFTRADDQITTRTRILPIE